MRYSKIYLVGFMGAGKTSVGQRLASLLNWSFIDLDWEIESHEGKSIREIFRDGGETYFRSVEKREIRRLAAGSRQVVALGGGAFCDPENRDLVNATGISIWLDAPLDLILSRCAGDASRPLFTTVAELETLMQERRFFYEMASLRIDVAGLSIDEVARAARHLVESRMNAGDWDQTSGIGNMTES